MAVGEFGTVHDRYVQARGNRGRLDGRLGRLQIFRVQSSSSGRRPKTSSPLCKAKRLGCPGGKRRKVFRRCPLCRRAAAAGGWGSLGKLGRAQCKENG